MSEDLTAEELEIEEEKDEEDVVEEDEIDEDEDDETGDKDKPTPGESDDLKTRLDELEATNKGLIKSLSAQRGLRQDLQGELDDIKESIEESKKIDLDDETVSVGNTNIPVEFDDDGNMFIEPKYLKAEGNTAAVKALQDEIDQLKLDLGDQKTQTQESKDLEQLLNEKEGYTKAYDEVNKAWSYLKDDVFDAYLDKKGLAPPTTSDQAIDMIMGSKEMTADFHKKYPALDLESVLEANLLATPRYLRKALDAAIKTTDSSHEQLDLGKPDSLSNANSGGSDTPDSLLKKVANMSTEDYENLDPKTIAKIDKLLEASGQ